MDMKILAFVTFATALATAPVGAQTPVTVRCTPTDGSAAGCYYCPGYESVIKLTGTKLHCNTINLVAYHDLDVKIIGTWNGSVVEVTSIALEPESFSVSGNGVIGGRFDFNTVGPIGGLAANFLSLGAGFLVPFDDLAMQIAPASAVVLGGGVIGGNAEWKTRLDLPDDTSLIGLRIFGQGYVAPPIGAPYTTNVDSKVIG
jgi:hypothetical protein